MDLNKSFNYDRVAIDTGVWVEIGDEARVKVAKYGNKAWTAGLLALYNKNKMLVDRAMSEDGAWLTSKKLRELFAETVFLDWESIEDEGVKQEYSIETCAAVCEKYPEFAQEVMKISQQEALFLVQEDEEVGKSSGADSDGS